MEDFGFIRVAAATPVVKLADTKANADTICSMIDEAVAMEVSLIIFPELSTTGYTCEDLFFQKSLLDGAADAIERIAGHTAGKPVTAVIGAPVQFRGRLYNCAVVVADGKVAGMVPKIWLPTGGEFYEARWFASGREFFGISSVKHNRFNCPISPNQLFYIGGVRFGIEICEDLWTPIPPSSWHCLAGAHIIVNLSASNEVIGKHEYRKTLISGLSAKTNCGYIYCSAGHGESSGDVVFAGSSMIYEKGVLLAENERFALHDTMIIADIDKEMLTTARFQSTTYAALTPAGDTVLSGQYFGTRAGEPADTDFVKKLYREISSAPFIPKDEEADAKCREAITIPVNGLASRLSHIGSKSAVIGISGGLDSTLALLVTVLAFDALGLPRSGITAVTMPGYGTSSRTHDNAVKLMSLLGVTSREISIAAACDQHFKDIGHDKAIHDTTFENAQARERTQILMDIANQTGGIVVGTGDLSELALGWATYNGDHMSMYGVNAGIPKTLVKYLVKWAATAIFSEAEDILLDIADTPVSPELLPADSKGNIAQVTEDIVGPYELHDFFLYNLARFGFSPEKILFLAQKAFDGKYDSPTIEKWLKIFIKRFFSQQFKRSCMPEGPKVCDVSLSPRGDWRMPSDANSANWKF